VAEAHNQHGLGFRPGGFRYEVDGRSQIAHGSWYRGPDCHFNPSVRNLAPADAVIRHVVGSWAPKEPMIGPDTRICAFGSCFASNISEWLASRNFSVLTKEDPSNSAYVVRFGEGLVNSCALLQQFEWAFENKTSEVALWHGPKATQYNYDEKIRLETLKLFESTDIFILTLGLSEVWCDDTTGGGFWRAIPVDKFDPTKHRFRVTTVEENRANLFRIYQLVRTHRPNAKIIFTMSPIPLVATFRPVPCITANSASKAILRAALDEFLRAVAHDDVAYYWPSYEIVLDVFGNRWTADRRHVRDEILEFVMATFEHVWCHGTSPRYTLAEAWIRARSAAGDLPAILPQLFAKPDVVRLAKYVTGFRAADRKEDADLILQRAAELSLDLPMEDTAQKMDAHLSLK
jgi:hypothetical protein